MSKRRYNDGGIVSHYRVMSWILLRLFGASFLYFCLVSSQWSPGILAQMPLLADELSAKVCLAALGIVGLFLMIPFLTPSFIAVPNSVQAGAGAAVLLGSLSLTLYVLIDQSMDAGQFARLRPAQDIIPLIFKSFTGLAVSGAMIVGFVNNLAADEEPDVGADDDAMPWLDEMRANNGDERPSSEALKALRKARTLN